MPPWACWPALLPSPLRLPPLTRTRPARKPSGTTAKPKLSGPAGKRPTATTTTATAATMATAAKPSLPLPWPESPGIVPGLLWYMQCRTRSIGNAENSRWCPEARLLRAGKSVSQSGQFLESRHNRSFLGSIRVRTHTFSFLFRPRQFVLLLRSTASNDQTPQVYQCQPLCLLRHGA
ncbi:hypothetical protein HNQ93_003353 [Hymenobacter luteus]|uniref:Uncharacterized protein n=2 Tax=Hymenobacter TaxID=89966 RepID=A0A7W9T482_9BACT|nr:hypothetical protein [Hymenobacter latericoloratus]MBB6060479.1 hypothetical protein [Hymenobacter luteus]